MTKLYIKLSILLNVSMVMSSPWIRSFRAYLGGDFPEPTDSNPGRASHWGYEEDNGPSKWVNIQTEDGNFCQGERQSPININTHCTKPIDKQLPLRFHNYDVQVNEVTVGTSSHGVAFSDFDDMDRWVEGGVLDGRYFLEQMHFHWGSNSSVGSEHTINGKMFPLELHLVHRSERFKNLTEAAKDPIGLAVLGVLYHITPENNNDLSGMLKKIKHISGTTPVEHVNTSLILSNMLPSDTSIYYHYEGSLTTPPCSESVLWFVFDKTYPISEDQMEIFRSLLDVNQNLITDNFRPTQALRGRSVFSSIESDSDASAERAFQLETSCESNHV